MRDLYFKCANTFSLCHFDAGEIFFTFEVVKMVPQPRKYTKLFSANQTLTQPEPNRSSLLRREDKGRFAVSIPPLGARGLSQ